MDGPADGREDGDDHPPGDGSVGIDRGSQFAAVGPQQRFIRMIAFVPADRVDETRAAIEAIARSIAFRP
jgi:hypothetical protein